MQLPNEVDVDGREVQDGILLIGKATRREDGKWTCLANVHGALCLVEVKVRFNPWGSRERSA